MTSSRGGFLSLLLILVVCAGCGDDPIGANNRSEPLSEQAREAKGREIAKAITKACDDGTSWQCLRLANWLVHGSFESNFIIRENFAKGFSLMKRACELGESAGCARLGRMFEFGQGVAPDHAKAIGAYEKSCSNSRSSSVTCANIGRIYDQGSGGVTRNYEKARRYYGLSCYGWNRRGCAPLGRLFLYGRGGESDYTKARSCFERACDDIPSSWERSAGCVWLGQMYEKGLGVERDIVKALRYNNRACQFAKDSRACDNVARIQEEQNL